MRKVRAMAKAYAKISKIFGHTHFRNVRLHWDISEQYCIIFFSKKASKLQAFAKYSDKKYDNIPFFLYITCPNFDHKPDIRF